MSKLERSKFYVLPKSKTVFSGPKNLKRIIPNDNCTSIVKYGDFLGSNIGMKLTNFDLKGLYLDPIIKQILVGILLGDGNIRRPSKNGQPQIQYNQGFVHLKYILFLSSFLYPILVHCPSLIQRRDLSFYLHIHTRCMDCLNPLFNLFIKNGVKTISPELIN